MPVNVALSRSVVCLAAFMVNRSNPKSRCVLASRHQTPTAPRRTSCGRSSVRFWTKERISRVALRPPTRLPTPLDSGHLSRPSEGHNSRFFTNCYSDSAWIASSPGHARPHPKWDKPGYDQAETGADFCPPRARSQLDLPAQKRRDIELVVLRLRMHRSGAATHVCRRRGPLCELGH